MNGEYITKGVANAFEFWLSQHDISTPSAIESAISKSFENWLNQNSDEIIDRVASKVKVLEYMDEVSRLRDCLQEIANTDYRGNRSHESKLAFDALNLLKALK
jgi:hypothetical protein